MSHRINYYLTAILIFLVYIIGSPKPVMAIDFVTVSGNQFTYRDQPWFIKGVNVGFGRYFRTGNRWQMYYDYHPEQIESEIVALKQTLGLNTLRIWLPEPETFAAEMQYRHASPAWFNPDGSINPVYRSRLIELFNLVDRHQLKIQLILNGPYLPKYTDTINHEYVPVGGDLETFWFTYLDSLIPFLKDHPAILSYEILNESLINWPINGEQSSWLEPKILSYQTRIIQRLRLLDPNHLIASSELIYPVLDQYRPTWWYPVAEFALVPDVDQLNNGQPFSLYSQVDYLSPHLYSNNIGGIDNLAHVLSEIKNRSQKPLVLGEFGHYRVNEIDTGPNTLYRNDQTAFFTNLISNLRVQNYNGLIAWDPWPLLILEPGFYTKHFIDGQYPAMEYTFSGRQTGTVSLFAVNDDQFWLFDHTLSFFPAGNGFAQAFTDIVPNRSIIGDLNDDQFTSPLDFNFIASDYGHDYLTVNNINTDLNRDGFVDYLDYQALANNYR